MTEVIKAELPWRGEQNYCSLNRVHRMEIAKQMKRDDIIMNCRQVLNVQT